MTRGLGTLIGTVAALVVTAAAVAQNPASEPLDRQLFQQLIAKVRDLDREYEQVVSAAMNQARSGDGRADLELQARMLSLRESRDRTMSRLIIVASRHEWEVPDFDAEDDEATSALEPVPVEAVFAPAARIVQERFAEEARRIAWVLRLPVISLPAGP